jgi:hypothetical protein
MYKLGIWREKDLMHEKTWFGTSKPLAYTLLNVSGPILECDCKRFERVIRTVRLGSGVFRTTHSKRFADVDPVVQSILENTYAPNRAVRVCDWAASDALASLEWADTVFAHYPFATMEASDTVLHLVEASNDSHETFILEPDGTPLQYIRPPFVVSTSHRERCFYPVNVAISWWAARRFRELERVTASVRWKMIADTSPTHIGRWRFHMIPLIHPSAARAAACSSRFRIAHHDVFVPQRPRCDVLRLMNLFNPKTFSPERTKQALTNVLDSIEVGGFLIVGRTMEGPSRRNDVSIIRKSPEGVKIAARIGRGWESETLLHQTSFVS